MITGDYQASDAQQFALAVQQLEQCAELIEEATIPKLRMAVVLTDNLADTFLFRYCWAHIVRVGTRTLDSYGKRRMTKKQVDELTGSFPKRLAFATSLKASIWASRVPEAADADILTVGHRYRNAIYHRDSHNAAAIPVIARLFYEATCRLFPASASRFDYGVQSESMRRDLESVSSYDVIDKDGLFYPYKAASKVADSLQLRISQDPAEAAETLSADIKVRCEHLGELAKTLPSVGELVPWTEFWHRYGHDSELVGLANRSDMFLRYEGLTSDQEATWADISQAQESFNQRVLSLWASFSATYSLDELARAIAVAEAMPSVGDVAAVLRAYEVVDYRLSHLERYVWEIDAEFDRMGDLEYDSWREDQ